MNGYKIVYKEPDGTITKTFFGEPMTNIGFPNLSNMDIVTGVFSIRYPECEILFIEPCSFEEFSK